jgi:phospholipid/cholesterol/gamma-HCH transport system substrate-binding protein
MGNNLKVGMFVLATLVLLAVMILKVGDSGFSFGGEKTIYVELDSAVGIDPKTPVQIAGVDVGTVSKIELLPTNKARLSLSVKKDLALAADAKARIKTTGMLGDAFIELYQSGLTTERMPDGGTIREVESFGDMNSLIGQMSNITDDVKAITSEMRKVMGIQNSAFNNSIRNMEKITGSVARLTEANEKNLGTIIVNLKSLSQNMNAVVANNMGGIGDTVANLDTVTTRLERGEGTVGRLLKDEDTVDKLNESLDGINDFLGGTNKLKIDFGAHTEFLGGTGDFKNYVTLAVRPRPDKYFLFELVSDPDPSPIDILEETTVESNGTTSSFTTHTRTQNLNKLLVTAQFVKRLYDFNLRGGLIESTGGFGADYSKGPVTVSFSAFDFKTKFNEKPHLKFWGQANVTDSLYLMGGFDDVLNPNHDLDWFLGAGFTFTDDDIKSLLGFASFRK